MADESYVDHVAAKAIEKINELRDENAKLREANARLAKRAIAAEAEVAALKGQREPTMADWPEHRP